ncbi:hypothetical protein AB0O22_22605 [Streptomyces sp. NPDC091204]|uniref:hypothetical protein n=1 Tax=Streptomyces sp. NPDC091204 TaxID=3155299 RepID=UPI003428CC74
MSGADEGVRADAHAVWAPLSGFAEAAAVVLATPSECREAMLGALDRCWEELRVAGRHRPPYASDAGWVFDRFEAARSALQLALWAAAAVDGSTPGLVALADQADLAGPATPVVRPGADQGPAAADRTDPDLSGPGRTAAGAGGNGGADQAGAGASGAEPARAAPSPPGGDGPGAAGLVGPGGSPAGTAAVPGPERAADQAVPAPEGPSATGSTDAAASVLGTQSPSDAAGPGSATLRIGAGIGVGAGAGAGGTPDAARRSEPAAGNVDGMSGATTVEASPRPGTAVAGTTGTAAAGPGPHAPSGDAGATPGTGSGAEAGAPAKPEPAPDPLAGFADALGALEAELLAEQIRYLPRSPQSTPSDPAATTTATADRIAATWQRVHMALLRLPATLRTEWRARADEVAAAAGLAVTAADSADPDVIVPGLPQGLYAAERVPLAIVAPRAAAARVPADIHLSLGTSPEAVLDLPSTDPRLAWAVRADQALRLVELDPELHVAALVEEQPSSLAPHDERVRYRQHLDRLLGSAGSSQASGWPADGRLGAAHNLDMVLGGLVHKRPAAPGSWWWQWRTAVSRILAPLAESAGYELVPKPIGQWRKHDLDSYAVKQTVPGVGQAEEPLVQWVVWTPLKPKSSYTRNERKGRVVIRPVTQYGRQATS